MNVYEAIRILALRQVVKENDSEYFLRRVFRWYSKTFYTPLHVVEDLPIEFILQTYWESQYEEMESSRLDEEIKTLLKTDEERKREDRAWDEQQAEEVEFTKLVSDGVVGKKDGKIKDLKPEPIKSLVPETVETQSNIEKTKELLNNLNETLSSIKELPPDVHMTFGEVPVDEDFGEDSIPVPVKPK